MMLSPSTRILMGIGLPPGKVIVQPDVFPVATTTDLVAVVSPAAGTEVIFHLPATSARLIGEVAVVAAVEDDVLVVSTAVSSFFAHPARTRAVRSTARLVERCSVGMDPPFQITNGFRSA